MYKNAIKMPVLDRSTSVASVAVRTGLDRFLAVFSGFGPVFFVFSILGNRFQLRFVEIGS